MPIKFASICDKHSSKFGHQKWCQTVAQNPKMKGKKNQANKKNLGRCVGAYTNGNSTDQTQS